MLDLNEHKKINEQTILEFCNAETDICLFLLMNKKVRNYGIKSYNYHARNVTSFK